MPEVTSIPEWARQELEYFQERKITHVAESLESEERMIFNAKSSNKALQYLLLGLQVLVICVLCFFPGIDYAEKDDYTSWAYGHFQDVHVMIFIGFGFLMTFLKDYNWSSLGFNFLLAAVAIEWHYIVDFVIQKIEGHGLNVSYATMFNCEFAAGAVLISFGALLGKVNHLQLVVMALFEIVFYKLNEHANLHWISNNKTFADIGGSMIIHAFGAYFGLAASWALRCPRQVDQEKEGADYKTDLFAMIGTIFLWMYWPSFNSIPATDEYERQIVAINTYTALAAACITTFALSGFDDAFGRFDMVHIQNATLAGGVAMGSSANFQVGIGGAVIIGSLAGAVSTIGYQLVHEKVLNVLKIHDTCGVHNLHGMPGIMGALFSMLFGCIITKTGGVPDGFSVAAQAGTLGVTLLMAIVGGLITGFIMKAICKDEANKRELYEDAEHWKKE